MTYSPSVYGQLKYRSHIQISDNILNLKVRQYVDVNNVKVMDLVCRLRIYLLGTCEDPCRAQHEVRTLVGECGGKNLACLRAYTYNQRITRQKRLDFDI